MAKALGMVVLVSERKGASAVRTGYTPFEQVIEQSDIISLHCPATPDTLGLIGERELGMMKSSALLINTARGALIDEPALASALQSGKIAGAALDVLQVEPPQEQHRFVSRRPDNLLLTPHIAWASQSAINTLANVVSENIASFLNGQTINRIA